MCRILSLTCVAVMITACGNTVKTVGLNQTISSIQSELVHKGVIPVSNYTHWNRFQKSDFEYAILNEQCFQHTADPLIPSVTGVFELSVNGSYTTTGGFTVNVTAPKLTPSLDITAARNSTEGQVVTLPVQYAPLSTLPDIEMKASVDRAGTILGQSTPSRELVITRILQERDAFYEYVNTLVAQYNPTACTMVSSQNTTIRPLFGLKKK